MIGDLVNRPTVRDTVANVFDSIIRPVVNVGAGQFITTADGAVEDAMDNALLLAAIKRRAGRPLSSYRSLEELMREAGD